ncbi:MAG: PaaI family thioesterase [Sandaracinaceae bacterium]
MTTVTDAVREARERGEPDRLLRVIPYARWLDLEGEMVDGAPRLRMPFSPRRIGDSAIPALHGGTIGALLESAAVFTAIWINDAPALPKTVSMTVDYLRSGRAEETFASAQVLRHGRRILVVEARAWQDDPQRPIARAKVCIRMRDPERSS